MDVGDAYGRLRSLWQGFMAHLMNMGILMVMAKVMNRWQMEANSMAETLRDDMDKVCSALEPLKALFLCISRMLWWSQQYAVLCWGFTRGAKGGLMIWETSVSCKVSLASMSQGRISSNPTWSKHGWTSDRSLGKNALKRHSLLMDWFLLFPFLFTRVTHVTWHFILGEVVVRKSPCLVCLIA